MADENLTENTLRRLYLEEGLSEGEIAQRYGTYQVKVGRLRRRFGVPTLTKSDRLDLPEELSPKQRSILVGSMLGDGGLRPVGRLTARYSEHHSLKQRAYLDWKATEWRPTSTRAWPTSWS